MSTIVTINSTDLISNSRADINTNFANLNSDKIETSVIDTDTALAADSDAKIPSQKAVKAYIDTQGGANASETVRGIVEEATDAEVTAGTATGGTGAKLIVTPAKLATRLGTLRFNKKVEIDTTAVTHGNSTTETTLFDTTITGGTLGTNQGIKFRVSVIHFSLVTGHTVNIKVYYGGSSLDIGLTGSATVSGLAGFIEGYIVGNGATNAQKASAQFFASTGGSGTSYSTASGCGTATWTENSTVNATLAVKVDWGINDVGDTISATFWEVEQITSA